MKDTESFFEYADHLFVEGVMECQFSSFCHSNMIRKDPIFKTLMLSRKGMYGIGVYYFHVNCIKHSFVV